jgi:hypothetical protein
MKMISATAILATVTTYGMTPEDKKLQKADKLKFLLCQENDPEKKSDYYRAKAVTRAKLKARMLNSVFAGVVAKEQLRSDVYHTDWLDLDGINKSELGHYAPIISECARITQRLRESGDAGTIPVVEHASGFRLQGDGATFYKNACDCDIYKNLSVIALEHLHKGTGSQQ